MKKDSTPRFYDSPNVLDASTLDLSFLKSQPHYIIATARQQPKKRIFVIDEDLMNTVRLHPDKDFVDRFEKKIGQFSICSLTEEGIVNPFNLYPIFKSLEDAEIMLKVYNNELEDLNLTDEPKLTKKDFDITQFRFDFGEVDYVYPINGKDWGFNITVSYWKKEGYAVDIWLGEEKGDEFTDFLNEILTKNELSLLKKNYNTEQDVSKSFLEFKESLEKRFRLKLYKYNSDNREEISFFHIEEKL